MTELEALANRVPRLETQNRWFKRAGVSAVGVVTIALVMGQAGAKQQAPATKVVEAEKFVLRDKDGRQRGSWGVDPDGSTALSLRDKDGKERGIWVVSPEWGTALILCDPDGKLRGDWTVRPDGSTRLSLRDKDGRQRGGWAMLPDGTASLSIYDEQGNSVFSAP